MAGRARGSKAVASTGTAAGCRSASPSRRHVASDLYAAGLVIEECAPRAGDPAIDALVAALIERDAARRPGAAAGALALPDREVAAAPDPPRPRRKAGGAEAQAATRRHRRVAVRAAVVRVSRRVAPQRRPP